MIVDYLRALRDHECPDPRALAERLKAQGLSPRQVRARVESLPSIEAYERAVELSNQYAGELRQRGIPREKWREIAERSRAAAEYPEELADRLTSRTFTMWMLRRHVTETVGASVVEARSR